MFLYAGGGVHDGVHGDVGTAAAFALQENMFDVAQEKLCALRVQKNSKLKAPVKDKITIKENKQK